MLGGRRKESMAVIKTVDIFLVPELGQGHLCHHFPVLDQAV